MSGRCPKQFPRPRKAAAVSFLAQERLTVDVVIVSSSPCMAHHHGHQQPKTNKMLTISDKKEQWRGQHEIPNTLSKIYKKEPGV